MGCWMLLRGVYKRRERSDLWVRPHKDVVVLTCMHLFVSAGEGSQTEAGTRVNGWSEGGRSEYGLCKEAMLRGSREKSERFVLGWLMQAHVQAV